MFVTVVINVGENGRENDEVSTIMIMILTMLMIMMIRRRKTE